MSEQKPKKPVEYVTKEEFEKLQGKVDKLEGFKTALRNGEGPEWDRMIKKCKRLCGIR